MQQVAVRGVQLDGLEAEPHRPLRRLAERGLHRSAALVQRLRPWSASKGTAEGATVATLLARRQRFSALPGQLDRGFAARMPDLDTEPRSRRRHPARGITTRASAASLSSE